MIFYKQFWNNDLETFIYLFSRYSIWIGLWGFYIFFLFFVVVFRFFFWAVEIPFFLYDAFSLKEIGSFGEFILWIELYYSSLKKPKLHLSLSYFFLLYGDV